LVIVTGTSFSVIHLSRENFENMAIEKSSGFQVPPALKIVIGAGGIYAAFLYYGALQEDVFHYRASDGGKFTQAWFLQALEAVANVIIGGLGLLLTGGTPNLPLNLFALSGGTQVCAKAFTSLALASGVSFPVVTLAKSGKMVPVMMGSLIFGGASYTLREYLSVLAIIVGTTIVSTGKKSSGPDSSMLGIAFVILSLACDGVVGGMQARLQAQCRVRNTEPKPYDMMFWTNLFMALTAAAFAVVLGEATTGIQFCLENPVILEKIIKFSVCSAIGQSFIFYTIANFDPLVCTTVTTTRKVFSVLLSIFLNGHAVNTEGWVGIGLASAGILSELFKPHKKKEGKKAH
jgi:UDP-galactose transporter B1